MGLRQKLTLFGTKRAGPQILHQCNPLQHQYRASSRKQGHAAMEAAAAVAATVRKTAPAKRGAVMRREEWKGDGWKAGSVVVMMGA
eukprot:1158645-Pelagomonas_calceolata.AAC.9